MPQVLRLNRPLLRRPQLDQDLLHPQQQLREKPHLLLLKLQHHLEVKKITRELHPEKRPLLLPRQLQQGQWLPQRLLKRQCRLLRAVKILVLRRRLPRHLLHHDPLLPHRLRRKHLIQAVKMTQTQTSR
jgi:hypothetical protein